MRIFRFSPIEQIKSGEDHSRARLIAWPVALFVGLLVCLLPQPALALGPGVSLTPSTTEPFYACPNGPCDAINLPAPVKVAAGFELPDGGPLLSGGGELGGYDPKDLQSAYHIPITEGKGQTVAIVDAYGDKTAESDLAKYREKYGLSACTKSNGCFKKVNERGEERNYPEIGGELEEDWGVETSLDLDMVSAACPNCHILLVEASTQYAADTGASVNKAAELGASAISNSYGYPETYEPWCGTTGCKEYASDYSHPGIAVLASSGDYRYDNADFPGLSTGAPSFPATAPSVISVGGTKLSKESNSRGWNESVWNESERRIGTDSGCSLFESKPTWQKDTGCTKRTANDVSADSACETPVSIYRFGGWANECGTSAASPLMAGMEALTTAYTRSLGAEVFYKQPRGLFDVTTGSNGTCSPAYLCTAEVGYDGPTGYGTPDGAPSALPAYSSQFGSLGTGEGQFEGTERDAIENSSGDIWVEDSRPERTEEFTSAGKYIRSISVNDGEGIAVSQSNGDVYIVKRESVDEFSSTGVHLGEFSTKASGDKHSEAVTDGIAIASNGNIWVTDQYNERAKQFTSSGTFVSAFSLPEHEKHLVNGGEVEYLYLPVSIAISGGNLYVLNHQWGGVREYTTEGILVRQFEAAGEGEKDAQSIATDPTTGSLYVAVTFLYQVDEFTSSGTFMGSFGGFGHEPGEFLSDEGVAINGSGDLYVTDRGNDRVQEFVP